MGNDLFGGGLGNLGGALGGIVSGLANSGLAPADDPNVKLIQVQSEVANLRKQEQEIFVEIGKKAFEQNPAAWPQADKLRLIQTNIAEAEAQLNAAKQAQEQATQAKEAEEAKGRCPSCGFSNPEGVKFCQECGSKLGASNCTNCGAQLPPGTNFCGECGSRQE